jgi:hypothetical protein
MGKITLLVAMAILLTFVVSSTAQQKADPAKMSFNGLKVGSTYAQVVKALGKPKVDGPATDEGCIGAQEKMVEYDGVKFYMMNGDSKDGKTFEVKIFTVTSSKYTVSGIRVGDDENAVRIKLGRKYVEAEDPDVEGNTAWSYEFDAPGFTTISFAKGKVVSISSMWLIC